MKELLQKKWFRVTLKVAACIVAVYAMVCVDVVLRARSAYLEGEKYWDWNTNPAHKEIALKAEFDKAKAEIDGKKASGKLTAEQYAQKLNTIQFEYDRHREDSSIKYAYIWYQTAVELFTPPESKWVKLAREKMPKAKELWRQELKAKHIPFEEYMLD
jgi:hypothetical protein